MTGIDAISRCSRRADHKCLPIIKPLKPLKPFKTMSRSAPTLDWIGGFSSRSQGTGLESVGGSCAPCWMPGSTQDLTLYGGAATGSMTRYDERHENLIRPDFQYIIRVTKKSQVTTTMSRRKPKKNKSTNRKTDEAVRSAGLPIRHLRHSFSKLCALPWSPVQGPVHLEVTARDLVASRLRNTAARGRRQGHGLMEKTGT